MRQSKITRTTKETDITLALNLDGTGKNDINTGCGFLDHMLVLFASHGRFDLEVKCKGDYHVDFHHTAEDVGICLGLAFREALGEKKGITRYGNMLLPMDEALILSAVDFSGRAYLVWDVEITAQKVGDFDTELAEEGFRWELTVYPPLQATIREECPPHNRMCVQVCGAGNLSGRED